MCCLFFLILHLLFVSGASARDWLSPPYTWLYQFPLPIPPVKTPKWTTLNPITNKSIDYYEINILPLTQNVYPGKAPAKLVGYDGISPGPTFRVERGTEAVVRFINNSTTNSSIHLHGSYSRAPWDGWAEDVTGPGQYKDYYYPNHQAARTLWYHDHSLDHTAERAYFGQAGVYILHDPAEDDLNLPRDAYDVPLVLASKQYNSDGTLFSPALETTSLYGDVIHVNGQPWPYFNVEARPYRFRLLDASISRSFFLYLERDTRPGEKLEFQVVGSDAGLLGSPQKTTDLYISMAERYEIVVDFSKWKGENITLRNTRGFAADEDFLHTDKVMRFVVSDQSVSGGSNSIHSPLRTIPYPLDKSTIDHVFRFERIQGEWKINGVSFADIKNRVLARPARGRVELWQLINGGGGWSHPVHIHLIDFKVVQRKNGRNQVFSYEAAGLKDVVWLGPGEEVLVEAVFAPWDGVYMFHCHNLIHEDHDMMGAFNVSYLADLGYNETHYIDPMETRWRAKPYSATAMQESVIRDKIADMAREQPYNLVDDVEGVLDRYWATATVGGTASTTVTTVGGTRSATTMTTTTRR